MMELKTNLSLEKHARDFFMHGAFCVFQHELVSARDDCTLKEIKEEGSMKVHTIGELSNAERREVHYDASSGIVKCSCKLFESEGITCRHILTVLRREEVNELPSNLIVDGWEKQVTRKPIFDLVGHVMGAHFLHNNLTREILGAFVGFHKCLELAGEDSEKIEVLRKRLCDLEKQWKSKKNVHRKRSGERLKDGMEKALEQRKKTPRLSI